jgi:SCY1-like protein 2
MWWHSRGLNLTQVKQQCARQVHCTGEDHATTERYEDERTSSHDGRSSRSKTSGRHSRDRVSRGRSIPILWSFSLGPLLNLQQFQEFMVEIKAVSHKIEQEQVKKLRDLATNSSNGTEAIRSNDLMSVQSSSDPFASQSVGALKSQVSLPASPNAWHSNPTSPMNNILQPQTNISRTITPDHSLGGFTPMKPTSPPPVNSWGTNSMQTMHHMQPSMPASNPWGSPPMAPFASSGWAPAPPPAMNSSIWNNTRPQTLQPTLLNRTVEQSVPLGNQFSLQPPPSVTSSVTSSVPQAPAPKAGLDKYESLI